MNRTYRVEIRGGAMITRGSLELLAPNVASAEGVVSAGLATVDPAAYVDSAYELAGGPVQLDPDHSSDGGFRYPVNHTPDRRAR